MAGKPSPHNRRRADAYRSWLRDNLLEWTPVTRDAFYAGFDWGAEHPKPTYRASPHTRELFSLPPARETT